MKAPTRPALRYFGGKWRIAPWIIRHLPAHDCYVEPFAGGASVLLRKEPSPFEVLNDLDGEIVNYFRVLREQPAELRRLLTFTPWSRAELRFCYLPTDDPLERARRYYVRTHQGWFGGTREKPQGWRYQKQHVRGASTIASWENQDHIEAIAARLLRVQIENDDAAAVIRRFDTPTTVFYVDPPYPRQTRGARWGKDGYRFEMTDAEHERLAGVLREVAGSVVISSYPSALYERLYTGWTRVERATVNGSAKTVAEVLWLSPRAAAQQAQASMFGSGDLPVVPSAPTETAHSDTETPVTPCARAETATGIPTAGGGD